MMGEGYRAQGDQRENRQGRNREDWVKAEYSVKAIVDDENELQVARAFLKGLIDGWFTGLAELNATAARPNIFPKDLNDMLAFEETTNAIIINSRQFLGSQNFAKITDILNKHGGQYVSQGK